MQRRNVSEDLVLLNLFLTICLFCLPRNGILQQRRFFPILEEMGEKKKKLISPILLVLVSSFYFLVALWDVVSYGDCCVESCSFTWTPLGQIPYSFTVYHLFVP